MFQRSRGPPLTAALAGAVVVRDPDIDKTSFDHHYKHSQSHQEMMKWAEYMRCHVEIEREQLPDLIGRYRAARQEKERTEDRLSRTTPRNGCSPQQIKQAKDDQQAANYDYWDVEAQVSGRRMFLQRTLQANEWMEHNWGHEMTQAQFDVLSHAEHTIQYLLGLRSW